MFDTLHPKNTELLQPSSNPYFIFKTIITGLDLNLTGSGLQKFVQNSTGCSIQEFETEYQEIQAAWMK
jgi:hypothetical protein